MENKVVVLGSNSFSGAHFINQALTEEMQVIGMSRSPEAHPVFLPYKKNKNRSRLYQFHQLDLNHHLDSILEIIDRFQPSFIVNFASQSMVGESWTHPKDWFLTNTVSMIRFHDQLRKKTYLKKYVHISTPEVYGTCSGTLPENTSYSPSTPYAVSRAAADMSLMSFFKHYDFPVVFTRAANVFGPGQQLYRIIPRTLLFAKLQKKLQLHGGGSSIRSFIPIQDVVDGTLKVMRQAPPGEIYHFSTSLQISMKQLVEGILGQMGLRFSDCVEMVGERPGKDSAYLLDSTKAKTTLGWKDQISLEQGITETLAWVQEHFETLKNLPLDYIHRP